MKKRDSDTINKNIPTGDPAWDARLADPGSSSAPYRIYNLGNHAPVKLAEFISTIEELLNKQANMKYLPMQPGDVEETFADIREASRDLRFHPTTGLRDGLQNFINWYRSYYKV